MSRHKTSYVISYHGILCHDMSYVPTIAASLLSTSAELLDIIYESYVLSGDLIETIK